MASNEWGGRRSGAGRKKGSVGKGDRKTGRLVVSCTEKEESEIKEMARESGLSTSEFIRRKVFGEPI